MTNKTASSIPVWAVLSWECYIADSIVMSNTYYTAAVLFVL